MQEVLFPGTTVQIHNGKITTTYARNLLITKYIYVPLVTIPKHAKQSIVYNLIYNKPSDKL